MKSHCSSLERQEGGDGRTGPVVMLQPTVCPFVQVQPRAAGIRSSSRIGSESRKSKRGSSTPPVPSAVASIMAMLTFVVLLEEDPWAIAVATGSGLWFLKELL